MICDHVIQRFKYRYFEHNSCNSTAVGKATCGIAVHTVNTIDTIGNGPAAPLSVPLPVSRAPPLMGRTSRTHPVSYTWYTAVCTTPRQALPSHIQYNTSVRYHVPAGTTAVYVHAHVPYIQPFRVQHDCCVQYVHTHLHYIQPFRVQHIKGSTCQNLWCAPVDLVKIFPPLFFPLCQTEELAHPSSNRYTRTRTTAIYVCTHNLRHA